MAQKRLTDLPPDGYFNDAPPDGFETPSGVRESTPDLRKDPLRMGEKRIFRAGDPPGSYESKFDVKAAPPDGFDSSEAETSWVDRAKDFGSKAVKELSKPIFNMEALPKQLPIEDYPVSGRIQAAGRGLFENINKIVNVPNVAIMAASGGLSSLHPLVSKAISTAFGTDMARGAIDSYKQYLKALKDGDEAAAWDHGMGVLANAGFSAGSFQHGFDVKSPEPIRERLATPEELATKTDLTLERPPVGPDRMLPPPEAPGPVGSERNPIITPPPPAVKAPPKMDWESSNLIEKMTGMKPEQLHAEQAAQENALRGVETGVSEADLPSQPLVDALKSKYGATPQFSLPGRAPSVGPERLALASKKLSSMFGLTPQGITEAMIDANTAYREAMAGGLMPEDAQIRANQAFWRRVPVNYALGKLQIEASEGLAEALKSGDLAASKQMIDGMMKMDPALAAVFPEIKPEGFEPVFERMPREKAVKPFDPIQDIYEMGGLDPTSQEAADLKSRGLPFGIYRKTGAGLDTVRERWVEEGRISEDATLSDVQNIISDAWAARKGGGKAFERSKDSMLDPDEIAAKVEAEAKKPENMSDKDLRAEIKHWIKILKDEGKLYSRENQRLSELTDELMGRHEKAKVPEHQSARDEDFERFSREVSDLADRGEELDLPDTPNVREMRSKGVSDRVIMEEAFTDPTGVTDALSGRYVKQMGLDKKPLAHTDIDDFGQVNKKYGHPVGDRVLRTFVNLARQYGIKLARLGGEEFAFFPEHKENLHKFVQRIRDFQSALSRVDFEDLDGNHIFTGVTFSGGFGRNIELADVMSRKAKRSGKDAFWLDKNEYLEYIKEHGHPDEWKGTEEAYAYKRGTSEGLSREARPQRRPGIPGRETDLGPGDGPAQENSALEEPPLPGSWPKDAGAVINPVEFASRLASAVKQSKSYEEFKKIVESDKDLTDTVRFLSVNLQEVYDRNKKPFYSGLSRTINERMPARSMLDQVKALLKGENQEEVEFSGVEKWLEGKQTISKQELLDFLKENEVQVQEVVKGKSEIILTPNENEPHILEIYRSDDPTGAHSGIVGEIIKEKSGTFLINVPGLNRNVFPTLEKAKAFVESKTDFAENTKFSNYQLPGGENYREMLLTLPDTSEAKSFVDINPDGTRTAILGDKNLGTFKTREEAVAAIDAAKKQPFKSSHFDEPNVLAHVRFNDRKGPNGEKILFLEEVQSDWHQKGRESGYPTKQLPEGYKIEPEGKYFQAYNHIGVPLGESANTPELAQQVALRVLNSRAVPNAPFKKTWHELALKRMLRYAAENGYDKLAWTTGEQQAERYDLSKQIKNLQVHKIEFPEESSGWHVEAEGTGGHNIRKVAKTDSDLSEIIGKDMAKKVIDRITQQIDGKEKPQSNNDDPYRVNYSGLDLKVGGEGMKGFYDQMLPSFLNKYTKKWGGRVGTEKVNIAPEKNKDYYIKKSGGEFDIFDAQDPAGEPVAGGFKTYAEAKEFAQKDFAQSESVHSLDITPSLKDSVLDKGQPYYGQRGSTLLLSEAATRLIELSKKAKDYAEFRRLVAEDIDLNDTARFHAMNLRQLYDEGKQKADAQMVAESKLPKAVQRILRKESSLTSGQPGALTERERFFGVDESFPDLPVPVPGERGMSQKMKEMIGIGGGRANLEKTAGEYGKALAIEADRARDLPSYRAEEFNKRIKDIAKEIQLTPEETFNFKESLEGRAKPMNENVEQFFKEWDAQRRFFQAFRTEQIEQYRGPKDNQLLQEDMKQWGLENYYPHKIPPERELAPGQKMRTEIVKDMVKRGAVKSALEGELLISDYVSWKKTKSEPLRLAAYLVEQGQAKTMEDALIRLDKARRFSNNFEDGFFKERDADLPFYDPNPLRVIPEYNKRAMRQIYLKERFGEQGERLLGLVEKAVMKGASRELAEGVKDWVLGTEPKSEYSSFTRALLNIQTVEKMSFSGIANFFQGITGAGSAMGPRAGISASWHKISSMFSPKLRGEMKDFAESVGQNPDYALLFKEEPGNVARQFLGLNGFRQTEYANYLTGTFEGKAAAQYYFKRLQAKPNDFYARKQLGKLRVNAEQALKTGALSKDDLLNAGNYGWRRSQSIPDPLTIPHRFLGLPVNSDAGRLVMQFKRVAYTATGLTMDAVKEAADGNPGKLLWLLVAYPAAGEIITQIKTAIGARDPDRDKDKNAAQIYVDRLGAAFAFGLLSDLYYSSYFQKFPVGATADQLVQTGASAMEMAGMKKGWGATGRQIKNVPFIGTPLFNKYVKPLLDKQSKERAAETREKKRGPFSQMKTSFK